MRTKVKLHKKATVTLCRRFIPTKPDRCDDKPTQLDTVTKSALAHLTDNSHGIPDHRRRAPAFQPPPPRKPPRLAQAKRPQNEVAYSHLVVVQRTYLRRERPPFCVCAIRIAQIRRCTHTSLVRPPCVISTGHFSQAAPLKINVQSVGKGCC